MKFSDNQKSVYNGKKLKIEIFGASHAPEIGVNVVGLKGQKVDLNALQEFVDRRKAKNTAYSTKRLESDIIEVKKGVKNGVVGKCFSAVIKNSKQISTDYNNVKKIPRPAHADYVAWTKYGNGFDYRGGGKFSGRMTAPMCIAGGVCKQVLDKSGIKINAYIKEIGGVIGKGYFDLPNADLSEIDKDFPLLDSSVKADVELAIERAHSEGDSVGGVIECVISGVPVGAGEYMFDSLEGVISKLAFAVPAVKGIEFGAGFDIAKMKGSEANDAFYYDNEVVKTKTNFNGGINGGLSNGMPIVFRVAIKPTPSIAKEQDTVDLDKKQNVKLSIKGRHDSCIVPRAVPVIEAISAMAIYDSLGE